MNAHIVAAGTKIVSNGDLVEVVAWLSSDKLQIRNRENKYSIITPDDIDYVIDREVLEASFNKSSKDLSAYDSDQIAEAQHKYDVINKNLENNANGKLVENVAQDLACSLSYAYALIKRFTEGSFDSLIPEKRGRKQGLKLLPSAVENIIESAIDSCSGAGATLAKIVEIVGSMCKNGGYPAPSSKAVSKRIRQRAPEDNTRRIYGGKKARQDHRVRGEKYLTSQPLHMVQIDHCVVDVIVVDSLTRKPIGRPWMTIAIDVHTRCVLGFYLSLDHPSSVSNAACLVHVVTPKNKWLRDLNLEAVRYPMYGLPHRIHVDNGKDFRSAAFISGCAQYNIKLEWRPPGGAHYGGHIERYIGTLMRTMRGLPGATLSSVADKKRYSNLDVPGMTFHEMRDWIIEQVGIYHMQRHSGLGCSPLHKWESSLRDKAGNITPPLAIVDFKKLFIDFLPFKRGTIQRSGIQFNTVQYYSYALKRLSIKSGCLIKYNPLSIKNVWVKPDGESEYIECGYSDVRFPDCSLAEFKAAQLALKNESDARVPAAEIFEAVQRNQQRVASAVAATTTERRAQEKQRNRAPRKIIGRPSETVAKINFEQPPKTYDVE